MARAPASLVGGGPVARARCGGASRRVDNPPVLRTGDLDYDLPPGAVAIRPVSPRDSARLLVVSRSDERLREDARVSDLPRFLRAGDALVLNDTRTLPARLEGRKVATTGAPASAQTSGEPGGRVTGLFLEEIGGAAARDPAERGSSDLIVSPRAWRVLLKSNGRLREGQRIALRSAGADAQPPSQDLEAEVSLRLVRREGDAWLAALEGPGASASAHDILARLGATPLPPYILAARRDAHESVPDAADRAWYQTVYARGDMTASRSVAAPTAGLHFTPALLAALEAQGVRRERVTLHVGEGTFKPIETEFVEQHPMHEEWFEVSRDALARLDDARASGGRVIAVGTTTARTLESVPTPLPPGEGETIAQATRLLITPGFTFRRVDALLTNFHLPRSTLLALVGAFLEPARPDAGRATGEGEPLTSDGVRRLLNLYRHALGFGYRFYSYGDAMLILP